MDISIQHPWFRRALGSLYPGRLFDQFFGEGMFDYDLFPYAASTLSPVYRHALFRNVLDSSTSGVSEKFMEPMNSEKMVKMNDRKYRHEMVRSDRERFLVLLDVKHFSPDELSVKVTDDYMEIQGKHGERQDDHGFISREFHRRYRLPPSLDQSALTCTLSADGLLTLNGPKVAGGNEPGGRGDRSIPVTRDDKSGSAPSS